MPVIPGVVETCSQKQQRSKNAKNGSAKIKSSSEYLQTKDIGKSIQNLESTHKIIIITLIHHGKKVQETPHILKKNRKNTDRWV